MTVRELIREGAFEVLNEGKNLEQEITGPFCCDLLSLAMGRAQKGCAWVTVMAHQNVLAVASLTGAACVILAEGVLPEEAVVHKAAKQDITVLRTGLPVFEAALSVWRLLEGQTGGSFC